jgi:hypothetical protein
VRLLGDPQYRKLQRQRLCELSSRVARTGASDVAARTILRELEPRLEMRRRSKLEMTPVPSSFESSSQADSSRRAA